MNWFEILLTYAVSWWLVLLLVLPFGVRMASQPGKGHAASAPERPRIREKLLTTSMLTVVVVAIIFIGFEAWAANGIYSTKGGDCVPAADYVPSDDVSAADTVTMGDRALADSLKDTRIDVYAPVSQYSNDPRFADDVSASGIRLGTIDVPHNGQATMNGHPIGQQQIYTGDCK